MFRRIINEFRGGQYYDALKPMDTLCRFLTPILHCSEAFISSKLRSKERYLRG